MIVFVNSLKQHLSVF